MATRRGVWIGGDGARPKGGGWVGAATTVAIDGGEGWVASGREGGVGGKKLRMSFL